MLIERQEFIEELSKLDEVEKLPLPSKFDSTYNLCKFFNLSTDDKDFGGKKYSSFDVLFH